MGELKFGILTILIRGFLQRQRSSIFFKKLRVLQFFPREGDQNVVLDNFGGSVEFCVIFLGGGGLKALF